MQQEQLELDLNECKIIALPESQVALYKFESVNGTVTVYAPHGQETIRNERLLWLLEQAKHNVMFED